MTQRLHPPPLRLILLRSARIGALCVVFETASGKFLAAVAPLRVLNRSFGMHLQSQTSSHSGWLALIGRDWTGRDWTGRETPGDRR